MRLASYNVENLFQRARALNRDTLGEGNEVLKKYVRLNRIFNKAKYTNDDKNTIVEDMTELGIAERDDGGQWVILRQNKGKLVKRSKSGGLEVVADGRADWVGWLDLQVEDISDVATDNTARVIDRVNADVLAVVEAESRPALVRFSRQSFPSVGATAYPRQMLIDGNDERGIDVGVMFRQSYEMVRMLSHVDDIDDVGQIFSRDCPEYLFRTPDGNLLCVLVNHFKSQSGGSPSDEKRERQARRVRTIYENLIAAGVDNVAVVGDLNNSPEKAPLAPLLQQTNLRDVSEHPEFDPGVRPGTYDSCTAPNKIDYVLLSPALFASTRRGGIFRDGIWAGEHGTIFPHLPEITSEAEAASDHAVIWAEIDV